MRGTVSGSIGNAPSSLASAFASAEPAINRAISSTGRAGREAARVGPQLQRHRASNTSNANSSPGASVPV